jgi:hypothetical protein
LAQKLSILWENNVASIDALSYVVTGSNAGTADAKGGAAAIMPLAPMKEENAPNA